jgi:hypothetical protein
VSQARSHYEAGSKQGSAWWLLFLRNAGLPSPDYTALQRTLRNHRCENLRSCTVLFLLAVKILTSHVFYLFISVALHYDRFMHLTICLHSNETAVDVSHIFYTFHRIRLSFILDVDLDTVRMSVTKILPLFNLEFVIVCFRRLQSHCVTTSARQMQPRGKDKLRLSLNFTDDCLVWLAVERPRFFPLEAWNDVEFPASGMNCQDCFLSSTCAPVYFIIVSLTWY